MKFLEDPCTTTGADSLYCSAHIEATKQMEERIQNADSIEEASRIAGLSYAGRVQLLSIVKESLVRALYGVDPAMKDIIDDIEAQLRDDAKRLVTSAINDAKDRYEFRNDTKEA